MRICYGQLEIEISSDGEGAVVAFSGEADVASVKVMKDAAAQLAGSQPPQVDVLFERVRFVDLAGLRSLAAAIEEIEGAGSAVRLSGLTPLARRVVGMAGLHTIERVGGLQSQDPASGDRQLA